MPSTGWRAFRLVALPFEPMATMGAYELLGWDGLLLAITLLSRVLRAVVRAERDGPRH